MNYNLALTLGHGSSAVLISQEGEILIGYEEERLSKIKADNHFPIKAIEEIGKHFDLEATSRVYVSHWAVDGLVDSMSTKHWNREFLRKTCPKAVINSDIDHHDCHIGSLRAFAGRTAEWEIVADGFGNFNETLSIYNNGKLFKRLFGYDTSIGLLYQYTTAYLGLKMNQDEFKLLGYESMVKEVLDDARFSKLKDYAEKEAKRRFARVGEETLVHEFDAVAGLKALPNIRMDIRKRNDAVLRKLDLGSLSIGQIRVVLSYFVQRVTELFFQYLILSFGMKDVGLSGGVFMNVKLNNKISKLVDKVCVTPLCGDQGGGIGAYHFDTNKLKWPGHLFWGKRSLDLIRIIASQTYVFFNENDAKDLILSSLKKDMVVNVVRESMEFGPRALGNTSTFAMPTNWNVQNINALNGRSTVMPMAGMITKSHADKYIDIDKVDESHKYMIMTFDSVDGPGDISDDLLGCHHLDIDRNVLTNRIQLLDESHYMHDIVDELGPVINTSFNTHGVPIVFDEDDIIGTHNPMSQSNRVMTIVIIG